MDSRLSRLEPKLFQMHSSGPLASYRRLLRGLSEYPRYLVELTNREIYIENWGGGVVLQCLPRLGRLPSHNLLLLIHWNHGLES